MSETLALEGMTYKTFSSSTFCIDCDTNCKKKNLRDRMRVDENGDAGQTTPLLCSNVGCRAEGVAGV